MDELVFVDSTFDTNKTKEYTLSIQLGLDGFSFSIVNKLKKCIALNRFISFQKSSDNQPLASFTEIVRNNKILNLDFEEILLQWISNKQLIIPSDFFSEDFAYESFQLSHSLAENESLLWNEISELNAWLVFSMPNDIKEFVHSHFSACQLFHHSFPFYRKALSQKPAEVHPPVYVNIQNNFFHVIIPDRNGKHFINTFSYTADSDLAYYILNIYKQQKLNNERSKLIVDGFIQKDSKVILLLKKYLGQVELKTLPLEYQVNNQITPKEYNQFINLLNLSKCE
ncbi:DUF3822 family protein [Labilibaculum sp.]|uniref:DUF3822 family protein n=1 Tax=Labilibaculum sp. TaxID=2060723 RepID=UPI00356A79F6